MVHRTSISEEHTSSFSLLLMPSAITRRLNEPMGNSCHLFSSPPHVSISDERDVRARAGWSVRLKSSALDCACRGPEYARIDPFWIERKHLVVQLARRRRRLGKLVESADVLPSLFDDPGAVHVSLSLMDRHAPLWAER